MKTDVLLYTCALNCTVITSTHNMHDIQGSKMSFLTDCNIKQTLRTSAKIKHVSLKPKTVN